MRKQVETFSKEMESRLIENDHKTGWHDCSHDFLINNLKRNLRKLPALIHLNKKDEIIKTTADIANYAMMIADNEGGLKIENRTVGRDNR